MSYNFNQLILRKRLLGALLQRNTTEQIFFHLILLFFPTQFYTAEQTTESFISFSFPTLVLWSLTTSLRSTQILETLYQQTTCIFCSSCILYQKRESQIITPEGFNAIVLKSTICFSVSWPGFAWLRQEQLFAHSFCRLHNCQNRRKSTTKSVHYGHCRRWELASSTGLQQVQEVSGRCWELEG